MAGVDAETLKRLLDAHSAALTLYARQWCNSPEDIVQDVFLLLMREKTVPQNPAGWLFHAARNRALNAARASRRRSRHELQAGQEAEPWLTAAETDRLDAARAAQALADLPLEQREAIVARLWGGLSLEETAQLMGVSISTAFRRYQQGIAALRERLEEKCRLTNQPQTKTSR